MRCQQIEYWSALVGGDVALALINLAGARFYFLSGGRSHYTVPSRPTQLHMHWMSRLTITWMASKIDDALTELSKCEKRPNILGSFSRLINASAVDREKYLTLGAGNIDMVVPSAVFNPLPHRPPDVQRSLT